MATSPNPFGSRKSLSGVFGKVTYFDLGSLAKEIGVDLHRLPFTIRVILENVLRGHAGGIVEEPDVTAMAEWRPGAQDSGATVNEFPFMPGRVLTQDLTGVPAVVDLAAMRSAVARLGGDPRKINPLVPVDLVIDHSVQADNFGTVLAFRVNVEKEQGRNRERYLLLRWAQQAFQNFQLVPPGTGIVHQVNLEFLAKVVMTAKRNGEAVAFPDTVVGMDSHTTMVNGLGVLGWGVGGIEAEAVMLGQPVFLLMPEVVGVRITGALPEGATATDLALTLTQRLRKKGVVEKFVEFTGPGVSLLSLPDRATISNMAPEYGATAALFPIDDETLRYLQLTGRPHELVEKYAKEQALFRRDSDPEPAFSDTLDLDLGTVEPSVAGPRRPQDRVALPDVGQSFRTIYPEQMASVGPSRPEPSGGGSVAVAVAPARAKPTHGSVVIAAITSCTNTSNPTVLLAAGLLAKKAVERGLSPAPYVKTSLAPGSRAVTRYLEDAGLLPYLEALRFHGHKGTSARSLTASWRSSLSRRTSTGRCGSHTSRPFRSRYRSRLS